MAPDQETKQLNFFVTKEAESIMMEQMEITGMSMTELLNNALILYPKVPAAAKKKLVSNQKKTQQKKLRLKIKQAEAALNKLRMQEAALSMPS